MAFVHHESQECTKSELDLFSIPATQTQNKLTESRKSNSFSTFVVGTSLPDACDKRIKNVIKR